MQIQAEIVTSAKKNRPCLARRSARRPQSPLASSHAKVLQAGVRTWNAWRRDNPGVVPLLNDLDISVTERQFGRVQGGPINLSRAELCGAQLDQATLIEANLVGAVLTDADLSDARLDRADLRGAKLANANLDGAQLDGANLCAADLRQARGLTQAQIDQSVGDLRTSLPADLTAPKAWRQQDPSAPGRSADRTGPADVAGDETADPHAILGVRPGASLQDVRVAWLKLVEDLDRSPDELLMRERLKSINRAYQELKARERGAKHRHVAPGFLGSSRIVFAAVLMTAIAVGVLVAMIETSL
jgi:hypothetical protein